MFLCTFLVCMKVSLYAPDLDFSHIVKFVDMSCKAVIYLCGDCCINYGTEIEALINIVPSPKYLFYINWTRTPSEAVHYKGKWTNSSKLKKNQIFLPSLKNHLLNSTCYITYMFRDCAENMATLQQ